jgi:hypothetical protein
LSRYPSKSKPAPAQPASTLLGRASDSGTSHRKTQTKSQKHRHQSTDTPATAQEHRNRNTETSAPKHRNTDINTEAQPPSLWSPGLCFHPSLPAKVPVPTGCYGAQVGPGTLHSRPQYLSVEPASARQPSRAKPVPGTTEIYRAFAVSGTPPYPIPRQANRNL